MISIENLSDRVILAKLSPEPEMGQDVKGLLQKAADQRCHFIVDLQEVDMLTAVSITLFLRLKKNLADSGKKLVLCRVNPYIKGLFMIVGLEEFFEIADDLSVAMKLLEE